MPVLPVAVNLSARQFRQQQLDARIRALVRNAGVDPRLIELEITESQLMQDPEHAIRVLNALREMRGGVLYRAEFGTRMQGEGPRWDAVRQLFRVQCRRLGLEDGHGERAAPSEPRARQLDLFGG